MGEAEPEGRYGNAPPARVFRGDARPRKLNELTPAQLESWRTDRRREGVKAETINRDLATLRAALSRAVALEIIRTNPLLGAEAEEVDRHKRVVRPLTSAEKVKLIDALASS